VRRCTAKSKRSGNQCQKWAVRGRNTCHMHGGLSIGPKTKAGKERSGKANFRHGQFTKESQQAHQEAVTLIRQSKNFLRSLSN